MRRVVSFTTILVFSLFFFFATHQAFAQTINIQPRLGPLKCNSNADDTAIWIHPTDKSKSLIFGTDKQAGL